MVPFNAKHRLSWGGARNKASRVSHALPLDKAKRIIEAGDRALARRLAFNLFVTVHWEKSGLTDAQAAKATGDLIKLASDWMRYKGATALWGWVRENDKGDGSKGSHVHILLHCPASLPIAKQFRRWLKRITGRAYAAGAIKTRRIGGTLNCYATNPALYRANLDAVLHYCIKGISPADAKVLPLQRQQQDGGIIIGKRAAWSQNLGA